MTNARPRLTDREVSEIARRLYAGGPRRDAWIQRLRPYICPFGRLVSYVEDRSTVLDLGCGCGLFLGLLVHLNRVRRGVGFDSDPRVIETARQMASGAGRSADLLFELHRHSREWPLEPFSVVSLIDVLHHVAPSAQRSFFVGAAERVEPGGILLYKDMVSRPRRLAWANRLHDLVFARQWIHYLPMTSVERWAAEVGLRLKASERIVMLWYGHELRVFERPAGEPINPVRP